MKNEYIYFLKKFQIQSYSFEWFSRILYDTESKTGHQGGLAGYHRAVWLTTEWTWYQVHFSNFAASKTERRQTEPSTQKLGLSSICCHSVTSFPTPSIQKVGRPACFPTRRFWLNNLLCRSTYHDEIEILKLLCQRSYEIIVKATIKIKKDWWP